MTAFTAQRKRRRGRRPAWEEEPSFLGKSVKALFLVCYAAAILVPLWAVFATSIATDEALDRTGGDMVFLPTDVSFQAYFLAVLYTPGLETKPIQVLIQQWMLTTTGATGQDAAAEAVSAGMENAPAASLKMAAVICTIIPIVIMYPFIQKHFTKAVITGAIKG